MRTIVTTFAAPLAFALSLAPPAQALDIGKIASIQPNLTGTPAGGTPRTLSQGTAVQQNETIQSNASGRGQILFQDETTLTVAPDSALVLDEFVYAPGGSGGKLAISLTQGALRLIGGQATRQQDGVIKTPAATIGIRGSSALVSFDGTRTRAIFLMGERLCVGTVCTSRRGGLITSDGGYQGIISPQELAQILQQIDGPPPPALQRSGGARGVTGNLGPWTPVRSTTGALIPEGALDQGIGSRMDAAIVGGETSGGYCDPHDGCLP